MKVFPLTTDQEAQIKTAQAAVQVAAKPLQEAQSNLRALITTISGGAPIIRGWAVSDDGKSLVIQ